MCEKSAELRKTLANCERLSQIGSMMVRVHWLETEMESAKRSRFATGLGNGNEKIGRRCVQLNVRRFPVMCGQLDCAVERQFARTRVSSHLAISHHPIGVDDGYADGYLCLLYTSDAADE